MNPAARVILRVDFSFDMLKKHFHTIHMTEQVKTSQAFWWEPITGGRWSRPSLLHWLILKIRRENLLDISRNLCFLKRYSNCDFSVNSKRCARLDPIIKYLLSEQFSCWFCFSYRPGKWSEITSSQIPDQCRNPVCTNSNLQPFKPFTHLNSPPRYSPPPNTQSEESLHSLHSHYPPGGETGRWAHHHHHHQLYSKQQMSSREEKTKTYKIKKGNKSTKR